MTRVRHLGPPGTKWCPACRTFQAVDGFNSGKCADCYREYHREWTNRSRAELTQNMLNEAITAYGGRCQLCGQDDRSVLSIFPRQGKGVRAMLYNLRAHGYPPGYRVLCYNCAAKTNRTGVEATLHLQVKDVQ